MRSRRPTVRCRPALRRRGEHGKSICRKASWEAANVCVQTHGGFGFACGIQRRAQVP